VALADLLLMFLYLEVLAMIGQYFKSGQLPVRFPLYIGMVALARYLILDLKEMSEWRMLAVAGGDFPADRGRAGDPLRPRPLSLSRRCRGRKSGQGLRPRITSCERASCP
jgi:hypothetical protein